MAIVAAFDLIFPPVVFVDVSEQMSFDLVVAEHRLVSLLILVDKTSWWNLTDKVKGDSVNSDCPFHLIKVLEVEIYSLAREIVVSLATFFNASLER